MCSGSANGARDKWQVVTDRGKQFNCDVFKKWCRWRKIKPRYGAVAKYGSIAVLERFIRTLACVSAPRFGGFADVMARSA